jgi:hypothetical protein
MERVEDEKWKARQVNSDHHLATARCSWHTRIQLRDLSLAGLCFSVFSLEKNPLVDGQAAKSCKRENRFVLSIIRSIRTCRNRVELAE